MGGDKSRRRDNPLLDFCSVEMQQGKVLLDADWNESAAIDDRRLREILKFKRRVAAGISLQHSLLVKGLVKLPKHKFSGQRAGDAKAVAPGKGDVQHGKIAGVHRDGLVRGRCLHIRLGQRRGKVLKQKEGGKHAHGGKSKASGAGFGPFEPLPQPKQPESGGYA